MKLVMFTLKFASAADLALKLGDLEFGVRNEQFSNGREISRLMHQVRKHGPEGNRGRAVA